MSYFETLLTNATARVAAGAALLDSRKPGWAAVILGANQNRQFDMSRPTYCVLGLLFGLYDDGKAALGLITGVDYGFDIVNVWNRPENEEQRQVLPAAYAAIGELWLAEAGNRVSRGKEDSAGA